MPLAPNRLNRAAPIGLLLAWTVAQAGCCNPCLMQSPCGPVAAQPSAIRYGSVCEAPSSGPVVVGQAPSSSGNTGARVVISEPGPRLASRPGWRSKDPDSIARTRVEGNIDDSIDR